MTNDLEKQFFDTFGIDKLYDCYLDPEYPEITDRILLELIVIISSKIPFLGRAMYMEQ